MVSVSVGIHGNEIAPQLQLIAIIVNEIRKLIYEELLSFFLEGTINIRNQILNPMLSLERDNNTSVEEYNILFKLMFQSNDRISLVLNLGHENQ